MTFRIDSHWRKSRVRLPRSNLCIWSTDNYFILLETNERSFKWTIRWLRMIDELAKWFGKMFTRLLFFWETNDGYRRRMTEKQTNKPARRGPLIHSVICVSLFCISPIVVDVITHWTQIEIDVTLDSFDIYYLWLCVNLNWGCRMGICSSNFVTSHHTLTVFCFFVVVRSHFDQVSECRCIYQKPCLVNRHEHMHRSKLKCDAVYSS